MDILTIKGLKYHARHGLYEEEKEKGNHFEVDLIIAANLQMSAHSDSIHETIDYEIIDREVSRIFDSEPVNLIETLCKRIGDAIISEIPSIRELTVKLRKINPPIKTPLDYAEVSMSWQK
jgi:dihydroneopterin aldolase